MRTNDNPGSAEAAGAEDASRLHIYLLPNLFTAGNLFCGFLALTKIVETDLSTGNYHDIKVALSLILLAIGVAGFAGTMLIGAVLKRAFHDRTKEVNAKYDGMIAMNERGERGFGYDPVFMPLEGQGRTFSEMSDDEKNAISHRGRAFVALVEALRAGG